MLIPTAGNIKLVLYMCLDVKPNRIKQIHVLADCKKMYENYARKFAEAE